MLSNHPRPEFGLAYDDFRMMMVFLFSRNQDLYRTLVSVFLLLEYGAYWAPTFVELGAVGIAGARWRTVPWLVGTIRVLPIG